MSTPHLTGAIASLEEAADALRDARVAGEADAASLARYSYTVRGLIDALAEMEH